jgi:excinuclease ABC subunit C
MSAPVPDLQEKLSRLPARPGVYIMKDARGAVLYVGKAKNLRNRVRSYFSRSGDTRILTPFLVSHIADLDVLITENEKEALILENSLIKQHKPRYNVNLKDDKSYLYIRVSGKHPFPRLELTRRCTEDGSACFGPYSSAQAVRKTVTFLSDVFGLRRCSDAVFAARRKPCIYYQMRKCSGACVGRIDPGGYRSLLHQAVLFLRGRSSELAERLRREMETLSAAEKFEEAAAIRDRLAAIEEVVRRQDVVTRTSESYDVIGYFRSGRQAWLRVLFFQEGTLIDALTFRLRLHGEPDGRNLTSFLMQFYSPGRTIPPAILLPFPPADGPIVRDVLAERRGAGVALRIPKRGLKKRLVDMARENARSAYELEARDSHRRMEALQELQRRFALHSLPRRIECYDVSNISGVFAVAARVCFVDGEPDKSSYRRYRIRSVPGPDDFRMLEEALERRMARGLEEKEPLPQLMLIDGGRGQLATARRCLDRFGPPDISLIALAKGKRRPDGLEEFFVEGNPAPIPAEPGSTGFLLLQRIRDEAHRFAVRHHRTLRKKAMEHSILDEIPGVGPERKKVLIRHFGTVDKIGKARVRDLTALPGIPEALAERILAFLNAGQSGKNNAPAARATEESGKVET